MIVFRLLKVYRLLANAETSLKFFISRKYEIVNSKFTSLNQAIPDDEKEDFFLDEKRFDIYELYIETYFMSLKEVLKESPGDLPKARRRYFYVWLILRAVHLFMVFVAFRIVMLMIRKFLG